MVQRADRKLSRMGKRIAIVQSSYLPWKGYFDLIASVDEFILYDECSSPRTTGATAT